nr:hypothetical protein Iba_chr08eCG10330 [Ipomoea batatas]
MSNRIRFSLFLVKQLVTILRWWMELFVFMPVKMILKSFFLLQTRQHFSLICTIF